MDHASKISESLGSWEEASSVVKDKIDGDLSRHVFGG